MLIILSGTSSSGKISLALALQEIADRPIFLIEADKFFPSPPSGDVSNSNAEFRERISIAAHQALAAFGHSGIDFIVDGSLPVERDLREGAWRFFAKCPRSSL